jgi:hypothetical protein
VLLTGTTYFLNYTPDYYLDEAQWLKKMDDLFANYDLESFNTPDSEKELAHAFILASITKDNYIVADTTYNYYGKVPGEDFCKAVQSNRAIEFTKGHASYYAYPSYEVLELEGNQLKRYNNSELGLEILKKTVVDSLASNETKYKLAGIEYVLFMGVGAIMELARIVENYMDCEDKYNDLFKYVTQIINGWKYKNKFLRDMLKDFSKYFIIPGKTTTGIEKIIRQWDLLYNDFETNKNDKNRMGEIFMNCGRQLSKIYNEQKIFFSELNEAIVKIEKYG